MSCPHGVPGLRFLLAGILFCFSCVTGFAGYSDPAVRVKVVPGGQPTTAPNQPILVLPATGPASGTLVAESFNFTPTSYSWSQVQAAPHAFLAAPDTVTFASGTTTQPQVGVTFPGRGVYQLQLVATNGANTASCYVWVQVWDRLTGFNPLQQVGRKPALNPPPSVRQFSPDPGPYNHPRLLFTRADWPELNAKTTSSTEVSSAITKLWAELNVNFDKTTSPVGALRGYADILAAYADGGYDPAYLNGTVLPYRAANGGTSGGGRLLGRSPAGNLADALVAASYLAWVGSDPTLPQASVPTATQDRFRFLAKVSAAFAKVEVLLWTGDVTVAMFDMAVTYDLLYDWMTEPERNAMRDYLYGIGYDMWNTGIGGTMREQPANYVASGDNPNQVDGMILAALVIEGEESNVSASVQTAWVRRWRRRRVHPPGRMRRPRRSTTSRANRAG